MSELLKHGKKQNNNKSGKKADKLEKRRLEAVARQEAYSKLTLAQKLARPTLGSKEKSKLLSRNK